VDDETLNASTLAMVLRNHGFDADFFTNPLHALEAARSDAPDLLISEVSMSELSGIELALQVQEHCPDCKVLLISGDPDSSVLIEAGQVNGFNFEVLPKPMHPVDLLKEIQSLIETTALPVADRLAS
jgi:DNA-binding NtrC family response regulator